MILKFGRFHLQGLVKGLFAETSQLSFDQTVKIKPWETTEITAGRLQVISTLKKNKINISLLIYILLNSNCFQFSVEFSGFVKCKFWKWHLICFENNFQTETEEFAYGCIFHFVPQRILCIDQHVLIGRF